MLTQCFLLCRLICGLERLGRDDNLGRGDRNLLREIWQRRVRIRLIGIHLSQFEPDTGQFELFPDLQEEKARDLYVQVDQVRERFGFESVRAGKSIMLHR